jgi:hypothetical protein
LLNGLGLACFGTADVNDSLFQYFASVQFNVLQP